MRIVAIWGLTWGQSRIQLARSGIFAKSFGNLAGRAGNIPRKIFPSRRKKREREREKEEARVEISSVARPSRYIRTLANARVDMRSLNFPSPSPPHLLIIRTLFSATWVFFGAPLLSGGRRSAECAHRSARSSRSQDPLDRGRSSPASSRRENYTSTRQQTPAFDHGRARARAQLSYLWDAEAGLQRKLN
jgi:hypothetical protein